MRIRVKQKSNLGGVHSLDSGDVDINVFDAKNMFLLLFLKQKQFYFLSGEAGWLKWKQISLLSHIIYYIIGKYIKLISLFHKMFPILLK